MGWLLVIFDLPVTTKKERRVAQVFRKNLLDKGYLMLQYSVYARCAVTFDRKERLISDLQKMNPGTGHVRCLFITDAQWGQTIVLRAPERKSRYSLPDGEVTEQLKFW